jgi:hypothetical protein
MKARKYLNFTGLRRKLSETFEKVVDRRQSEKIRYSIHDALMSGFACMYFQDPSLLQFQTRMQEEQHQNNLRTLFAVENIPKETQMREIIDNTDSEHFRSIFKDFYKRLQRSKYLERFQIFSNLYYFPIDGSQFYSSKELCCAQCLTKEHRDGSKSFSHQVLQGGIMHPDQSEVIPFMPEQICNSDGASKQDCEMNAAKRLISQLRKEHPRMGFIIGGDALFSRQPIIEDVVEKKMHYIFAAKPADHTYMMEWLGAYDHLESAQFRDEKGRIHIYEWMNNVPLNGRADSINVNYFCCRILCKNKHGVEKQVYKNSWVTDLDISKETIARLVRTGRCRWKNENECFNVMKNHGYYMEHNYGHGKKHLCFNFYLLTLLAFFFHQIFELSDKQYQACRKKFGSKRHLWEKLRAYIDILVFEAWEALLNFALTPKSGLVTWANAPP